jgi:hypothetical protein
MQGRMKAVRGRKTAVLEEIACFAQEKAKGDGKSG